MQCSGPGPLGVLRMRYRSNAPSAPWSRNALRNGFYVTNAVQSARLSIRRVSEHHMVLADVCYPQDPTRSTLYGCDTEVTRYRPGVPGSGNAPRNNFLVSNAIRNAHLSIRRVYENRMVSTEVCDGPSLVRSALFRRCTDIYAPGAWDRSQPRSQSLRMGSPWEVCGAPGSKIRVA